MQLRTVARDCLYVNWALPLATAPELPRPLRYEIHRWRDDDWVFVSVLMFRLSGLQHVAVPWLQLSYPQMNVRLYVHDAGGVPSVLFRRMLVPIWVAPLSRWIARQPATGAGLSYPASTRDDGPWTWTIDCGSGKCLAVEGRLGAPRAGTGPELGSWDRTVDYFRHRPHGYAMMEGRLRRLKTFHPAVPALPVAVEVGASDLLADTFHGVEPQLWLAPHSAWLCSEIRFDFELGKLITLPRPQSSGVPATGVTAAEGC